MPEPSCLGARMGCPALLSTDLFWPPVRCVIEVDSCCLLEYLGDRGWPRKSRGKLASIDSVMITSQPFHHSGLLLLFSCPSVKESVYQTHFICKIMITWFSILSDILVTGCLMTKMLPLLSHLINEYRTKGNWCFFINRCSFIQGWMNGFP